MTGARTGVRPRGGTWLITAAIVVGALLAGCVWWAVAGRDGAPVSGPGGADGAVVPGAKTVHFEQGHGLAAVRTLLRTPADVRAFAGWYPQEGIGGELRGKLLARDLDAEVLVATGWSSGCTSAGGAVLTYDENTGYAARLTDTRTYETCDSPWDVLAVFAVPEKDAGTDPRIGGAPPGPPGPAELLAFAPLGGAAAGRAPRAAEVSQPDQFGAFARPLPAAATAALESRLGSLYDSVLPGPARRFAFTGRGCGEDLLLEITSRRLRPVRAGGACRDPRPYVAVFSVPADRVPSSAVIGG
ncbi:hypothetical protein AA958_30675 [Streptomyces sp. CNQ-509]|uniref:hypothetical protein n=1 Tax=Streptomyces sp. CNQ-509 TaxID=444103 RepID=UPI00062DCEA8|nr:hypothetical protein [Streptomyces sp. CNQ-509]AKH85855.1 hypothetical protein AA958_30675 [Streptomyces sp. CNQ-509]